MQDETAARVNDRHCAFAAIHHSCRRPGRADVRIGPRTTRHGTDRLDLVFEIVEGAKTTVNEISFAGNQAFGPTQLKAAIKTRQSNVLSFLLHDDIYDKDQLEA